MRDAPGLDQALIMSLHGDSVISAILSDNPQGERMTYEGHLQPASLSAAGLAAVLRGTFSAGQKLMMAR